MTKELTDPLFGLIEANERLETAQSKYNLAVSKSGPASEEAKDAAIDLTKAHQDAEIAADRFAIEGGQASIDAFRQMAREAGLDEAAINRVIRCDQTGQRDSDQPASPFR